jgi:hypothetical protein
MSFFQLFGRGAEATGVNEKAKLIQLRFLWRNSLLAYPANVLWGREHSPSLGFSEDCCPYRIILSPVQARTVR